MTEVTEILNAAQNGDRQAAAQLMPLVYAELQNDQHLDDERDAEEERDASYAGIAAALFECLVIQAVGGKAEDDGRCPF